MKSLKESLNESFDDVELLTEAMSPKDVYDKLKKLGEEWINPRFYVGICGDDEDFDIDEWIDWDDAPGSKDDEKVFFEVFPTRKDFDELVKYCSKKMDWTSCDPDEIGYIIDNWGDKLDEDGNKNEWYDLSKTYKNPHIGLSNDGGDSYVTGYTSGCDTKLVDIILNITSKSKGDVQVGPLGMF